MYGDRSRGQNIEDMEVEEEEYGGGGRESNVRFPNSDSNRFGQRSLPRQRVSRLENEANIFSEKKLCWELLFGYPLGLELKLNGGEKSDFLSLFIPDRCRRDGLHLARCLTNSIMSIRCACVACP